MSSPIFVEYSPAAAALKIDLTANGCSVVPQPRAHGELHVIPAATALRLADGDSDSVDALLHAGMWSVTDNGYRMERGPSEDWPLPIWRFGDTPGDGRLISIIPEPD